DFHVTGVQTCALPIWVWRSATPGSEQAWPSAAAAGTAAPRPPSRSQCFLLLLKGRNAARLFRFLLGDQRLQPRSMRRQAAGDSREVAQEVEAEEGQRCAPPETAGGLVLGDLATVLARQGHEMVMQLLVE